MHKSVTGTLRTKENKQQKKTQAFCERHGSETGAQVKKLHNKRGQFLVMILTNVTTGKRNDCINSIVS